MAQNITPQPPISVIMPVYNGAAFVGEAIASALAQTYSNFELIIINDGSTDGTAALLAQIKDPRVHIATTTNAGVSAARNSAIDLAQGEWLAFLDADDIWYPEKLSKQSQYFDDYDLICCNAAILSARGSGELLLPSAQLDGMNSRGILQLVEGSHPPMSSVCLRRAALGENRFKAGQRFGEDFTLWLSLVGHGARLHAVLEPLYHYRVHEASASAQTDDSVLQAAEILLNFSQENGLSSEIAAAARQSARNNFYHYCKLALGTSQSRVSVLSLAKQAPRYGASFMKVLMFAIM